MTNQSKRMARVRSESNGNFTLFPGEVHIWQISLEAENTSWLFARQMLTAEERGRADRYHSELKRRRFTIAHAAMRDILAQYLNVEPAQVTFDYGEKGKPELIAALNSPDLRFNLSHSQEIALFAITRGAPLGIDIEFVNYELAIEEIARCFFSSDEAQTLLALPKENRTEAFFCCWTRKEAYLKALGDGLSVPLADFTVTAHPDFPAALLRVAGFPDEVDQWNMHDIDVSPGYKAALAIERGTHKLCHRHWVFGCQSIRDKR